MKEGCIIKLQLVPWCNEAASKTAPLATLIIPEIKEKNAWERMLVRHFTQSDYFNYIVFNQLYGPWVVTVSRQVQISLRSVYSAFF